MKHNKKVFIKTTLCNNIKSLIIRYGSLKNITDELSDEYIDDFFAKNGVAFSLANIKEKAIKKLNDRNK